MDNNRTFRIDLRDVAWLAAIAKRRLETNEEKEEEGGEENERKEIEEGEDERMRCSAK